jgi:hypothetical protein
MAAQETPTLTRELAPNRRTQQIPPDPTDQEQHVNDTTTAEHWCPRRSEAPFQAPAPDRWDGLGGLGGQQNVGLSCSHCGSLNPDRFMELAREGWEIGPTDKNYKAYLGQPRSAEELTAQQASWSDGHTGRAVHQTALNDGKTEEEADAAVVEFWRTHEKPLVGSETVAKFYYQHLSEAQQHEFIELYNAKRMVIGYPGYFYARPYFCQFGEGQR